jgi:hypothetical protein
VSQNLRLSEDQFRVIFDRINKVSGKPANVAQIDAVMQPPKRTAKSGPSELELMFSKQITVLDIPPPRREFKFMENRDFRLDYAWPEKRLAVEVQGMVHRIKERFLRDIEKLAMAQILGWRVLLVAGQDVRSGRAVSWLVTLWDQT